MHFDIQCVTALKKKDDISKIDLVKLISFNTYVQISCPSQ